VPVRVRVCFGLDGTGYEIDLNAGHSRALWEALALCACGAAGRGQCTAASPRRAQGLGGLNST
jgi:hypothetical protein